MTASDVLYLFAYNKWANERMLASLDQLSDEQYTQALGSSFTGIRETVGHIAAGEWIWLQRWLGTSPKASPDWTMTSSLAAIKAKFAEIEAERAAFLSGLQDADVDRPISYSLMNGTPDSQPLGAQLQHIVNHSTYHRGQVATMLRQVGLKPTGTDLITYVRELAS